MIMSKEVKIAQTAPYKISVKKGTKYSWCSCGYSSKQPFCDGKHKEFAPEYKSVKWVADENKDIYFCGCKHAKNGSIFCDGSHSKL